MTLPRPYFSLLSIRSFAFGLCGILLLLPMAVATPVFEPVQAFVTGLGPAYPQSKLIQGNDGNFYGTTEEGGSSGMGTVFKMTPAGVLTTLVNFNGTNGSNPPAGLVQGSEGNFYGTTYSGGTSDYGTAFQMTPAGDLTTLVNFNSINGRNPLAGLVQGKDGNFYGTTYQGGSSGGYDGYGTVYKMTPVGTLTTLVNFNLNNGSYPIAGLVQDLAGDFYGTTSQGGSSGHGTVFKMTPAGILNTLVNFNSTNGSDPYAELLLGSDESFYGTTYLGGDRNSGTVFKMTPTGSLTTLVKFDYFKNGSNPHAGLVQGSDGNFYGTTYQGDRNRGTVFKMTPSGSLTTLVKFNSNNGSRPNGLVQDSEGNLYGTTYDGGSSPDGQFAGGGQIFRLRLGPSVTTLPAGSITSSSAQINAMVNPGGYDTQVTFQYGTSPTLATYDTVSAGTLPAGTTSVSVQANLTGFNANTVYYYRVVASNAENTVPQIGLILSTAISPAMTSFNTAAANAGLSGANALPTAMPFGEGVTNLIKYAFNMNLAQADVSVLGVSGNSGLPLVERDTNGAQPVLRIQFLRRIGSGLSYTPQRSTTLDSFVPMTGTQTITPIDAKWERVSVEEISTTPSNFAKVQVEIP